MTMRVLLQTTIPFTAYDWSIERFSMLHRLLAESGHDVTSRNKDESLAAIDRSDFDQIWLFAADAGDGLDDTARAKGEGGCDSPRPACGERVPKAGEGRALFPQ